MHRRHTLRALGAAAASTWLPSPSSAADATAPAPSPAPSTAALRGDIDLVRELLFTLHPGTLRYNTEAELGARLDALREAFAEAPDLATRYRLLSRLLATLRCGHSYANFFNQRPAVQAALFDRPSRLPFHFRWLAGEMVVTGGVPVGVALAPGDTVEVVNGVGTGALWQRLAPYARVDGHNEPKARNLLSIKGLDALDYFDCFHGVEFGVPAAGVHRLRVRGVDGRVRELEAPALSLADRKAQVPPRPTGDTPAWTWTVSPEGCAKLTMPGWALYNSRWPWQAWLNERLDELHSDRALRGLVVDVRGNEGGLDCGNPIVERFAREVSTSPGRRLVRYQRIPAHLNGVLDTWDNSFRDWGDRARPVQDPPYAGRYFELPAQDGAVAPRGPRITKPLVVLTDAANSSATFGFAERVRRGGFGTLMGQATGGNQRGINGGAFFFVRLPASGLEFDLPLIGYFPPGLPPDGGLAPDVAVPTTAADIAAGRDAAWLAAQRRVKDSASS